MLTIFIFGIFHPMGEICGIWIFQFMVGYILNSGNLKLLVLMIQWDCKYFIMSENINQDFLNQVNISIFIY